MNNRLDFIFKRRSIRRYTGESVDQTTIQSLLEAGASGPSAMACDPWHFIVVTERNLLDSLGDILPYGKMLKQAPLAIIVCGDINKAHTQDISYMLQDCSAAIENILLAANALGLGGVWLGTHPRQERMDGISKLFALPRNIIPVATLSIGHPAESKEARTRLHSEQTHFNKWQ